MAGTVARYDAIVDFYDATAGKAVTDQATATLLDFAGEVAGMSVLDLACGQGRVARELARRGADVTGLDISSALLAKARTIEASQLLGVRYVHGDATSRQVLGGQAFDGIVCNYGLSDIDDLDQVLANVARLLTAGGWFVFSVLHPCFPGWDSDVPSSWPPDQGYYREGWWLATNSGFRGKVGSNTARLFWPGRQTAMTTWLAGPLVGVCASITRRPSLVQDMLVNFSATSAGMAGRCCQRPVLGSRSQTSVTCVPVRWYAGSEKLTAISFALGSTAAWSGLPIWLGHRSARRVPVRRSVSVS